MTPQEREIFTKMQQDLAAALEWIEERKAQQISYPVDDASRITMGVGVKGTDSSTTAASSVIVATNIGDLKFLIA
jgi:hypothetical protein